MEQPKTIPANIFDEMAGMKDTKNQGKKIAENDNFFAYLDIIPLMKRHTLVLPMKDTYYIFDIWSGYL